MSRHSWEVVDDGIEVCRECLMYRCTAPTRDNGAGSPGRNRKWDYEYSLPDGTVIALNPEKIPPCISKAYDNPESFGKWVRS